jgi:hypothetical protein
MSPEPRSSQVHTVVDALMIMYAPPTTWPRFPPCALLAAAVCSQIIALPPTMYTALLDARGLTQPQQQQQEQQQQQQAKGKEAKQWPEPPVLFVHMPRDAHTAARVQEAVQIRQAKVRYTGCRLWLTWLLALSAHLIVVVTATPWRQA